MTIVRSNRGIGTKRLLGTIVNMFQLLLVKAIHLTIRESLV